jgi:predicted metal-binding membrane protein
MFYEETVHWILMVTAMMLPLLVVPIHQVAFRSYRWRRSKAITGFLAGYFVIWMFAGLLCGWIFLISGAAELMPASVAAPVILLGAAIWQLSSFRAAAMRKCHRTVALAPRGLAADLDCIRFGLSHGFACLAVCLPLMLAIMVSMHSIAAAAVLALLLYFERGYQPVNRVIPGFMLVYCSAAIAYSLLS